MFCNLLYNFERLLIKTKILFQSQIFPIRYKDDTIKMKSNFPTEIQR